MKMLEASVLIDLQAELGEGGQLFPDGSFRFVDIPNGKVFHQQGNQAIEELSFDHEVSKCLPWDKGLIVLGRNFLHLLDETGKELFRKQLSETDSNLRCSDGCVLPDGSILVGLVDRDLAPSAGSLIQVSNELTVSEVITGATIPNGVGVMPDRKSVVWVDSPSQKLMLIPIESSGMGKPISYFEIDKEWGVPDGLCVDSEGGIWVAMWSGGKVIRISPEKEIDLVVEVGCQNVTSCAFDLSDNLVITTATAALPEKESASLGAGGIWIVEQHRHGFAGLETAVAKVRHN